MEKEKIEAIEKAEHYLSEAWTLIYDISKGEMQGDLHDLRMAINSLEVKCHQIMEGLNA